MKKVQQVAITRALAILNALNVAYRAIDEDGNEYLSDRPLPQNDVSSASQHRKTSRKHLYLPYLEGIEVGEIRTVPATNEVAAHHFQAIVASYMLSTYGKGAHTSARNKDGSIDVLRMA